MYSVKKDESKKRRGRSVLPDARAASSSSKQEEASEVVAEVVVEVVATGEATLPPRARSILPGSTMLPSLPRSQLQLRFHP